MTNEQNQKIHEWLGLCWHNVIPDEDDSGPITGRFYCTECGIDDDAESLDNPDYSTEAGFFPLLKGLEGKGWEAFLWEGRGVAEITLEHPDHVGKCPTIIGHGLPEALAAAVLKLIEQEGA